MGFDNLQSRDGLFLLNTFLVDKPYIEGYYPSQGDLVVFETVKKAPSSDLENALRQRQSIELYGRQHGQDNQAKHDFKSLSVNPAEHEAVTKPVEDDDDDFDAFADDGEDESEQTKKRLEAYAKSKENKPKIVAKSTIVLDIKPWDDETNMEELEHSVRSIELDGLLWGASRLVPLAYTIRKLQITCVVEDDKVGTDVLEERIMEFEDLVQ